ncbi:MAG: acetoin utilization protein AcuC [Polyangiales bacterium]|jgi:acetoin utilization protein AcuC
MRNRVVVYHGQEMGLYGYEEKPWFQPGRLDVFMAEFRKRGLDTKTNLRTAGPASEADLLLFHTQAHIERVRRLCAANEGALDHGPTFARQSVETAATHMVGAVMDAARGILAGEFTKAFVPIAGFHHAHAGEARNYCLYNDCAVALSHLMQESSDTVAYIDIDAHFGDGVYEAFKSEPRVVMVDIHEDRSTRSSDSPGAGLFDGNATWTGEGRAKGTKLNIPIKAGAGDEEFLEAWRRAEQFVRSHEPSFVVFESGVDCLAGDPLANLNVTSSAVRHIAQRVCGLADEFAEGRLLVLGGGGYELNNMSQGWCEVVEALVGVR